MNLKFISFYLCFFLFICFVFDSCLPSIDSKDERFSFETINTFKDAHQTRNIYVNEINNNKKLSVEEKAKKRLSIDSSYLLRIIDLLEIERNRIASDPVLYSKKLNDFVGLLDEYNQDRLNLIEPADLVQRLAIEELKISEDISVNRFEKDWQDRHLALQDGVKSFLNEKATPLIGKTQIISEDIKVLDSTFIESNNESREMRYRIYVERRYKGSLGAKKYFHGTGEWLVRLRRAQAGPAEIILLDENNFVDERQ